MGNTILEVRFENVIFLKKKKKKKKPHTYIACVLNCIEQLTDFIWTTLLDPIAYRAYCLRDEISRQLDQDLGRRKFKIM
jgi:hypothetical protein